MQKCDLNSDFEKNNIFAKLRKQLRSLVQKEEMCAYISSICRSI